MGNLGERLASIKIGSLRYNSPWTQVSILGFVCFLSPGLFNALSGLGAGGTQNVILTDVGNAVLYAMFALTGFIGGSVTNVLGTRLTLCIGTLGYSLYVGSLWNYQLHGSANTGGEGVNKLDGSGGFVIAASAILGICAGLLWSAQGAIMMAYPEEKDKGRSFSVFWSIFTTGGVVGSAIALGIMANKTLPSVSTGVYLAFLILMLLAILVSWLVLPASYVVRGNGTVVELKNSMGFKEELRNFLAQFKDWRMLALFPMFFCSNYFYAYQGSIVSYMFTPRTRALSSLLSNFGAVVGAIIIGLVLDRAPGSRRQRAIIGWCFTVFFMCLVWGAGIGWQTKFHRGEIKGGMGMDWSAAKSTSSSIKAGGPLTLMFAYYMVDSFYQGLAYFTMSSLTNDPFKLARMAGYYKGVQSAGASISFAMDAVGTQYMTEVIVSFVIMMASLPLCLWVLMTIKDTNYETEDTVHVEQLDQSQLHHVAMPAGHHTAHLNADGTVSHVGGDEEKNSVHQMEAARRPS